LSKELLTYGIIVRDCSDFIGLDDTYFRVAVKTEAENKILVDTIHKILRG
jgi:putative threonine-phosphate decarboxylase